MIGLAEQSYKIKKILIDKVGQENQLIKLFPFLIIIVNIAVCFFYIWRDFPYSVLRI